MNRQRLIPRDFAEEGNQRAQQLGLALAATCDPEFLETILHHKAALDQFGGEVYIGTNRQKFDAGGKLMEDGEKGPGTHETIGYIFHYGSKSRVKQLMTEEEAPEAPAPPEVEESSNGAEPEAVEA